MRDDKENIVPDGVFGASTGMGRTVAVRGWKFSLREVLLGAGLLVSVFLVFLLAGLLGQKSSDLSDTSSSLTSAQAQLSSATDNLTRATQGQCTTMWCFETISHAESFLNRSYDPCDNFFEFSCGGYKVARALDPDRELFIDVLEELRQNNEMLLTNLLSSGSLPNNLNSSSSERKLKDFYSSCTNDFPMEQLKGTPFIQKVVPLLGGSYLLQTGFDKAAWNFNATLSKVETDLWVDAFYAPRVEEDQFDSKHRIIAIYPGGTGRYMSWNDYLSTTASKVKAQADYKKFMKRLATLLARDANVNDDDLSTRIDVFVGDAYDMEKRIATFASNSEYRGDAYSEAAKISLDDLNKKHGNEIDWTQQMTYLFNEAGVTGSTKVVVPYPTYLGNLSAMIRSIEPTEGDANRRLHNYLTWRVLEVYVQDLSGEYVHANRQMYVDKYGATNNFLGKQKYCFQLAGKYFSDALSALYVNAYFDKGAKDKVTEITGSVKNAIEDLLTKNTWMDKTTKDFAITKMKASTFKIGYPDFMDDQSGMDRVYAQLAVNASDFFGNLLAANQHHRRLWNHELRHGEDRDQWYYNAYDTNLAVYWYFDEVIVPAGILQFPMFTPNMPHYYTFGAIGSLLGHFIHHLIDSQGRHWDKGGDYIEGDLGWWSNQTLMNYNDAKQCVADVYNNVTQGPFFTYNGVDFTLDVDGDAYAAEAMTITTGVRLAYNAYQAWQKTHGEDNSPPGLKFTQDQLFFVAHAQRHCYNRDPTYDWLYTFFYKNTANEATRVNVALQELPEFAQAFNCKAPDAMVATEPCTYY